MKANRTILRRLIESHGAATLSTSMLAASDELKRYLDTWVVTPLSQTIMQMVSNEDELSSEVQRRLAVQRQLGMICTACRHSFAMHDTEHCTGTGGCECNRQLYSEARK